MPKWLYDFCERLQKLFSCCFPPAKGDGKTDQKKEIIVGNGECKTSQDQQITKGAIVEELKCVFCQKLFDSCFQKRVRIETIPVVGTVPIETPSNSDITEPKCNFCNRCKSCQADFDKDKTNSKAKKDIESRCNALNYLIFICILTVMFISNMALWLSMSQ